MKDFVRGCKRREMRLRNMIIRANLFEDLIWDLFNKWGVADD